MRRILGRILWKVQSRNLFGCCSPHVMGEEQLGVQSEDEEDLRAKVWYGWCRKKVHACKAGLRGGKEMLNRSVCSVLWSRSTNSLKRGYSSLNEKRRMVSCTFREFLILTRFWPPTCRTLGQGNTYQESIVVPN